MTLNAVRCELDEVLDLLNEGDIGQAISRLSELDIAVADLELDSYYPACA